MITLRAQGFRVKTFNRLRLGVSATTTHSVVTLLGVTVGSRFLSILLSCHRRTCSDPISVLFGPVKRCSWQPPILNTCDLSCFQSRYSVSTGRIDASWTGARGQAAQSGDNMWIRGKEVSWFHKVTWLGCVLERVDSLVFLFYL